MRYALSLVALALVGSASAQTLYLPATKNSNTTELNSANNYPFQRASARVQQFYDAKEFGRPSAVIRSMSLRYDGPTSRSAGSTTLTNVEVLVGVTQRGIAELGGTFAANLTQPLTSVFKKATMNLAYDSTTTSPAPWGGPGGQFTFSFSRPVVVAIPPGGCFAYEISVERNAAPSTALLDWEWNTSDLTNGRAAAAGTGCPSSATGARALLTTAGQRAPGAPISIAGSGWRPNAAVLTVLGVSNTRWFLGSLPWAIPGTTPVCNIYTSTDILPAHVQTAPASGTIVAYQPGTFLHIPKDQAFCNVSFHLQSLSPIPPWSGNALGIQVSNYQTVTLGCYTRAMPGYWWIGAHISHKQEGASFVGFGGHAVKIN